MTGENEYSLSVIIPNYNKEKYIEKCITSILNQSVLPYEIIIVDDCSTDNSRSVIEELRKRSDRIKPIYLKKNGGVSNARNIGLKFAQSQYVTFTDSDDFYYNTHKLQNEINLIRNKYPEDVVAYSAYGKCDSNDRTLSVPNCNSKFFMEGNIFEKLLARQFVNIPRDYIVKRKILENVGAYSYPQNFFEDYDLLIRLSKAAKFYCTFELGIMYRITGSGLSVKSKDEYKVAVSQIVNIYLKQLPITKQIMIKLKTIAYKIENKLMYSRKTNEN